MAYFKCLFHTDNVNKVNNTHDISTNLHGLFACFVVAGVDSSIKCTCNIYIICISEGGV